MTTASQHPPVSRRTRPGRRSRRESLPMERDEQLPLLRLEHAITSRLALAEQREYCAELSEYLDAIGEHERLDALCEAVS